MRETTSTRTDGETLLLVASFLSSLQANPISSKRAVSCHRRTVSITWFIIMICDAHGLTVARRDGWCFSFADPAYVTWK
ncbi:hypothetical protein BJX76DRAFT_344037 [Aspergillus varians]